MNALSLTDIRLLHFSGTKSYSVKVSNGESQAICNIVASLGEAMTLFRRASLFHIYFLGMIVPNAPIFWFGVSGTCCKKSSLIMLNVILLR